ncbi:hypothetical protein NBRC110019_24790 [Neptunitalea chrysea]|uniref:histidine kinase n=1 Tax=Neptunitalea chrysea TaxID=1647581 RepID=A0A9W6EWR7_9FLAO|nr:PAS domain-containing sensor histidine kinase [Neptunitalea chrysea]GLB53438.1 hypothetical protein NBRC110019_24790 [Neptunitalea chrysea]
MENKAAILKRALQREKEARRQSERILEKKSAELYDLTLQLQESNNKLQKLFIATRSELTGVFANLVDAYLMMDLSGNVLKMNEAAIALLGYNNISDDNLNILDIVVEEDKEDMDASFKLLLKDGELKDLKIKILTKYNTVKILHINCSLMYNEAKKAVAIQGIFRDITKQREDEQKLLSSENRLFLLIEHLDSGVLLQDELNNTVLANKRLYDLFNLPERDVDNPLDSQDIIDIIEDKDLFEDNEAIKERYKELISNRVEVLGDELVLRNGKVLERNYSPVFEDNVFKGHLWSFNDITFKKKYRKSLEAERQKYSNIIANMNLGLIEVSVDNKILMANQTLCKMTGYEESDLLGRYGADLVYKEGVDAIEKVRANRKNGISSSYEVVAYTKKGAKRYWLVSGAPNYSIEGKLLGSIGVVLDITDLKNLELQKEALVRKLEKSNAELQEYAHIVSHDLKSPLRSIYALVSWLKEDNEGKLDDMSMQNFALIESTLEKMEQLITDILNYSSAGANTIELEQVNTSAVIKEILQLVYIPANIKVNLDTEMPVIQAEKTKIQQLFQNLISNAIKFIDKPEGVINIGIIPDKNVYKFYVKDNGIGIEQKYHEKIFEIFHSLNKSKDSTGIGLSIVKKIVTLYGGDVWVESENGNGTTFYFTINKKIRT